MAIINANQWEAVHSSPEARDGTWDDPESLSGDIYHVDERISSVLMRFKYPDVAVEVATPVVVVYGRDSEQTNYERLVDRRGRHLIDFEVNETEDPIDGPSLTFRFSQSIEIPIRGFFSLLVAVKVAATAASGLGTTSTIDMRMLVRS